MKILITGSAGFIGAALTKSLLKTGAHVIGVDNHNTYYDPKLKLNRLKEFDTDKNYIHYKLDIADEDIFSIFSKHEPDLVINLAAQAGVRYSISNPSLYVKSNLVGFSNILEACKIYNIKHLIYASSSSVYGGNNIVPFSEQQNTDQPLSLYAATKKSNEILAYSYSHLFQLPTTGLRFFTVYGPWGRPDMALFKFTKAILNDEPIEVFNYGQHHRDFTYIDDVIEAIKLVIYHPSNKKNLQTNAIDSLDIPYKIYNVGNGNPINLIEYIRSLELYLGKKANIIMAPYQPGDVLNTFADTQEFERDFKFKPKILVDYGIKKFVEWYLNYHHLKS